MHDGRHLGSPTRTNEPTRIRLPELSFSGLARHDPDMRSISSSFAAHTSKASRFSRSKLYRL